MTQAQTQVWKKAVEIYAEISELSVKNAITQLESINNLSYDIKQAVITLINSGNQSSQYIQKCYSAGTELNEMIKPDYQLGSQVGEYELIEKLGEGGMSQVFKAKRSNKEHQKLVAIKIFSPINNTQELREHFITEQRILSELNHENIVTMLHGGKTQNDITYLVMELIENALPINQYVKKHQTSTHDKIDYILQCAKALSYSHANLIIHRDLKPDNILIDQHNKLKIVDFGIAKLINNELAGNTTTIMALTPNYAAPEQVNSEKISVATDVFSLAVVALELLVGKQCLPKDRLIKSCTNDEKAIIDLIKSLAIDKDLKNILSQALQQDPKNRYASMQSFADDLDNCLQNKPVNATAQSLLYRLKKFAYRRKGFFSSIILFITLLITGLTITTWQYNQIKIEAGISQQVKQFMLDTFNVTDPNLTKGNSVTAKDLLKVAAIKLNKDTNMNPDIKFELYQSLAIANDQLGFSQEAIKLLKQSLLLQPNNSKSTAYLAHNYLQAMEQKALEQLLINTDETLFTSDIDRAKFSLVRAENLSIKGQSQKAIKLINSINTLKDIKNNNKEMIHIQQALAGIYYEQSEYIKSINVLKSILKDTNLPETNTLILNVKLDLGRSYNTHGEHDLAMLEFNQIETIYKQILGDKHPDLGFLYLKMASSFYEQGQIDKAHEYAQLSHDTNINVFGDKGSQVAQSLNMLAILSDDSGDVDKAIALTNKSLALLEESFETNHPMILEIKTNLATLYGFNNHHQKSLDLLRQVYDLQIETVGLNNYTTLNTEAMIVKALTKLKMKKEAKKLALEHLQREIEQANPIKQKIAGAYFLLAQVYLYTKEHQKRLEALLEIERQNLIDKSNPGYIVAIFSIAQVYGTINNTDMAKQYFKKSFELNANIYSIEHISTLNMKILYAQYLKKINQDNEASVILAEVKRVIKSKGYNNVQLNKWIKQLEK